MIAFSARIVAVHATEHAAAVAPQPTRTRRGRGGRGRRGPLDHRQPRPLPDEFALVAVAALAVDRTGDGTRWHTATTFAPAQVSDLQAAVAASATTAAAGDASSADSDSSRSQRRPSFTDGGDLSRGGVPAGMHDRCIPTAAVTEWAGARVAELMRNALSSASGSFQADACGWTAESSPAPAPPGSIAAADLANQQQRGAPQPVATVVYPRCLVDAPSLEAIIHISVDSSSSSSSSGRHLQQQQPHAHGQQHQHPFAATTAPMIAFVDTDELFFADDAQQQHVPPQGFSVLDVAHAAAAVTRDGSTSTARAPRSTAAKRNARHHRLPPAQVDEARHWRPRLASRDLGLLLPAVLGQQGLGSSMDAAAEALASLEHAAVADAKVLHWVLRLVTLPDGALVIPSARRVAPVSCDPLLRFDVLAARQLAGTALEQLRRSIAGPREN